MIKGEITMATLGNVIVPTVAVSMSLMDKLNNYILPFFDVPFTVVTMALAGAGVSFLHGDKEPDVRRMFKQIVANSFLALLLVVLVPRMFHMSWVEPEIAPVLAAGIAWSSRWGIPLAIKLMPDIFKQKLKLREYKDVSDDEYNWSEDGDDSLKKRYYDEHN